MRTFITFGEYLIDTGKKVLHSMRGPHDFFVEYDDSTTLRSYWRREGHHTLTWVLLVVVVPHTLLMAGFGLGMGTSLTLVLLAGGWHTLRYGKLPGVQFLDTDGYEYRQYEGGSVTIEADVLVKLVMWPLHGLRTQLTTLISLLVAGLLIAQTLMLTSPPKGLRTPIEFSELMAIGANVAVLVGMTMVVITGSLRLLRIGHKRTIPA